ncbi:MAG TPA: T6SS effector BTH_I2691 family protein [Aquabacterium sp.]|nr:T6SS effector BTH_I2691 family protein [Aquabacterium sp.]
MSATAKNCSHCHKSSLSLLLLRPSPIATHSDLQAPGSAHTVIDEALVKPFIPDGLKESRPVLRLLRAGYVHLHIPSRDTWLTWRVTDEADLLAHNHPLFATPSVSAVCCRAAHNVSGFKLLTIPDAADLMGKTIWLAFSANLWSDKLKKQNKANPKAMVAITLGATQAKAPAFTPTAQNLKRQVLECNVQHWRLPAVDAQLQPAFPFTSLSADDEIAHMAATLKKAAAGHTETKDKELAVVLPDPVGYAAELNALRLIAEKHRLQLRPSDTHKLQSHFVLEGLVNNVADVRGLNNVAPVISRATFDLLKRSNPTRMQGATWEPLQAGSRPSPQQMGRQWTPQARQTFQDQAPKFEALARKEIESGYDRDASQKWVVALEKSTRDHLACYEQQWLTARDHAAVGQYFALHFDDEAANRPGTAQGHSPGATYIREVSWIDGPAPKTSVTLLEAYMAAYAKQPDDPHAFAVRAMAANQKELFGELAKQLKQLAGDPNGDEATGGMRDKSVDFIKGLLEVKGEQFRAKYSWLSDLTMSLAMGPMNNLAAAASTYVALEGADALKKRPKVAALAHGAAGWFGGMNTALKSAMTQKVVRPVLIHAWVDNPLVNRAIVMPSGQVDGWMGARPGGRTLVTLLTDTDQLKKGPLDLGSLISSHDAGSVAHGKAAGSALAAQATGAIVLNVASGLTPQQGAALFAQQVEEARKIGASVRAAMPTGVRAVSMSIDGRLALASVIVQSIGIINGMQAVDKAELALSKATDADRAHKEKALRDAQLGYMDSMGGLVAGSLDTLRVAGEAMNLQRGAAAGTMALTSIDALKFGVQVAGVFGGFLNGYVSRLKADEAKAKGLDGSAQAFFVASVAFYGTGATALAPIASTGLNYMAARQVGGRLIQTAATRLAVGVAAGGWIPVAGWVLLGAGMAASVGAALLEPTQLEAWARQTPFGKGLDGQKFKTLDEQNNALNKALGLAAQPETTGAKAA